MSSTIFLPYEKFESSKGLLAKLCQELDKTSYVQSKIQGYATYYPQFKNWGTELFIRKDERSNIVFSLCITPDALEPHNHDFNLQWHTAFKFMAFTVSPYPACCGLTMFHSFNTYSDKMDDAYPIMISMLESIFNSNGAPSFFGGWGNRHVEIVMVDTRHHKSRKGAGGINDCKVPVIELDKLDVNYMLFLDYFRKNAKKITDVSFYNDNSGCLLHRLDVLF